MSIKLNQIWHSQRFRSWSIVILIFLIAFLLRVVYPISRPLVWSDRAVHFSNAILEQDWPTTFQRYHPGVTIMWLSGIALQIFSRANGGLTADQLLGVAATKPGTLVDALQASVIPVALVIAACIALTYPLLRRLAGHRIALVGALLLAIDPFYIGYSKVIHPDALLSTFMLLSVLFILLYIKEDRWPMLIFSGLFAGLSFLSKSPSVFLLPYTGLVLTAALLARWHRSRQEGNRRPWLDGLWFAIRTFLIWGAAAAVIYVILWPAMWVKPVNTMVEVFNGLISHSGRPHKNPIFFNGRVWVTDPGIRYYLATIGWKTTAVTLPFILAAVLFAIARVRSPKSWPLWALLAYVFFFTIQMTLGQFKQLAYLLPAFPALDVIAAFGLVWTAEAVSRSRPFRRFRRLDVALISVALLLQFIITLSSYPYFSSQNNHLLGGTRVAQNILPLQDQGEGLEEAARFLNSLPYNQYETAQIYQRNAIVFQREFEGRTTAEISPFARYRVYDINPLMRELGDEEWKELWEQDRQTEPLYTVDVNGVTHVWIYGDPAEDPAAGGPSFDLGYQFGDHIRLNRARLSENTIRPGDPLLLMLNWESDGQISRDYTVFAHLLTAEGELVAQQDGMPLLGIRPTYTWREGEELEDPIIIRTEAGLPPGAYMLSVGMYDSETLERLPVFDQAGNRVPDDRLLFGQGQVTVAKGSGE